LRAFIRHAPEAHEGRIQETADTLRIDRSQLWEKMKQLGLAPAKRDALTLETRTRYCAHVPHYLTDARPG
jgi:Bacterial regulatory protein, Fis family